MINSPEPAETALRRSHESYSGPKRYGARSMLMYHRVTAIGMVRKGSR